MIERLIVTREDGSFYVLDKQDDGTFPEVKDDIFGAIKSEEVVRVRRSVRHAG